MRQQRHAQIFAYRHQGYRHLHGQGLEIGALHHPAPLPAQCQVTYCDVASQAELIEQFPELAEETLVDIDYICDLDQQGLSIFANEDFDFVVFSHVIEHIANPIYVIAEVFRVTRPGGWVVIAAPDKNFTVDKQQPVTSFQHLLTEYQQQVRSVTDEHFIQFLRNALPDKFPTWSPQELQARLRRRHNRREHVHFWDCTAFKDFLLQSFALLGLSTHCVFESTSEDNGREYFAVWQKLK